jgi:hypothetical protein
MTQRSKHQLHYSFLPQLVQNADPGANSALQLEQTGPAGWFASG